MKTNLQRVLDEILLECDELNVKPNLIYPSLQVEGYLTQDEIDMIQQSGATSRQKLVTIFSLLKPKEENVFFALQNIFHKLKCFNLCKLIQNKLKEAGSEILIWQPSIASTNQSEHEDILKIRDSLMQHLEEEFEILQNYWQKFNVRGNMKMDTFYNHNIIIRDNSNKFRANYENVDQLFATNSKRFVIVADAGYGKSTFVHEMAHQWTKQENSWTKQFSILFLFRLTEVSQIETQSLETLLTKCLSCDDAATLNEWFKEGDHLKKCLFIFDGLDELQHKFCKDVDDIIFGKGYRHPYVVVTSRPCQKLEEIEKSMQNNIYIELKGYTKKGIEEQLKSFKINPLTVGSNFNNVLKVPLFNTLFCITSIGSPFSCFNICTAIEKFVKFACTRYRNTDNNFSEFEQTELLLTLGQASQSKFSLIHNIKVHYPNVTTKHLSMAKETGLVYQKSTLADFVFSHQTIAEYCAAYFWNQTNPLRIKEISKNGNVTFANPSGGTVKHTEPFSSFLSHLDLDYKLHLWENFETCVPLLDEYETLPVRILKENELNLRKISFTNQPTIIDTVRFLSNCPIYLYNASFESGKTFENISTVKNLELSFCSIKISPEEFFRTYHVHSLQLYDCHFCNLNSAMEPVEDSCKKNLVLERLKIWGCNFTVLNFISYIFKNCSTLKSLKLIGGFLDSDSGISWIPELKNNQNLLRSIQDFELNCSDPGDWTALFETLGEIVNLKKLRLDVDRRLKMVEVNTLNHSLEYRLKHLEEFNSVLEDENGKSVRFKKSK